MPVTREVRDFTQSLAQQGLVHDGVEAFALQMQRLGCPPNFLEQVTNGTTYITERKFEDDFKLLLQQVHDTLPTPYALLTYFPHGSEEWLTKLLVEKGITAPEEIIPLWNRSGPDPKVNVNRRLHGRHPVFIDDWIITSQHAVAIADETKIPLNAYVLYATDYGYAIMHTDFPHVNQHVVQTGILLIGEALSAENMAFIKHLYDVTTDLQGGQSDGLTADLALLSSWHKRPDRIPTIFTGERRVVGTEERLVALFPDVIPPYRRKA